MPLPICTHCEQYEGLLMTTMLTDGDTQVICANDLLLYVLTLAATVTEGLTVQLADAYASQLDAIYAHDPRPIARPARRAKASAKTQPSPEVPARGPELDGTATIQLVPPCDSCGGTTATGDAHKLVCDECGTVIAAADDHNMT
jgi:hypothetical protein